MKALAALLVLTIVVCESGAQHIAYKREKNSLGRQLRQKEAELRTVAQAYQSLQAEKALLVAQTLPQATANLTGVLTTRGPTVVSVPQSGSGRHRESARLRATNNANASRPAQLADVRRPARRGSARG